MSDRDRGTGFKAVTGIFILVVSTLIIAGAFDLGWKNGEAVGKYVANSNTYSQYAKQQIQNCFTLVNDADKAECIRQVVNSHNESERAESDLVAQTEMSDSAFLMLIVTVAMAIITAIGIVFVWRTLLATQEMARDAREIGEAQVRAYLTEPTFKIRRAKNDRIESVSTIIVNAGQSPAVDVSIYTSVGVIRPKGFYEEIPPETLRETLSGGGHSTVSGQLAPGGSRKTINSVAMKDSIDYGKGAADILIFVCAEWGDVFGLRHKLEYCVIFVEENTGLEHITHFQVHAPLTRIRFNIEQ